MNRKIKLALSVTICVLFITTTFSGAMGMNVEKKSVHDLTTEDKKWKDYPGFYIHTRYDDIEKNTPILQSIFRGINVDNDSSTGQNGRDVKVSFFVFPFIEQVDWKWVLSISFVLKVVRLGDEIKNGEFEIYLEGMISSHILRIGYYSAEEEEIPQEIREIMTVAPYIFYEKDPEFYINVDPVFDEENQNISIVIEYSNLASHKIKIDYYPAVASMIRVSPNARGKMNFSIKRFAEVEQTISMRYEGKKTVNLTLEDIPQSMEFSLGFSENYFEYEASDEFNASLTIEVFGLEFCMKIEYLPRHLKTQFTEEGGYLYIFINERKTKFIISNDLEKPTKYFSVTNLTGESIIQWELEAKGNLTIDGFKGMEVEIKLEVENVYFRIYSIVQAEYFEISWNLSIPGYLFIDTNMEWLNFYSFNFTVDNLFGILIETNLLKADDFMVEWQTEVPFFDMEGKLRFVGDITFAIMLNGTWYHIF